MRAELVVDGPHASWLSKMMPQQKWTVPMMLSSVPFSDPLAVPEPLSSYLDHCR
jgi:hypothetical protein